MIFIAAADFAKRLAESRHSHGFMPRLASAGLKAAARLRQLYGWAHECD
jgi:hypothetical protein